MADHRPSSKPDGHRSELDADDPAPDETVAGTTGEGTVDGSMREELIRQAAHRRYRERGEAPGGDIEDWLAAEAEVDQTPLE